MAASQTPVVERRIPPLESGDRLTRREFERRYQAMPRLRKAELIEGVVHMPSPVSALHARQGADLLTWLGTYRGATPKVERYDDATLRLDADNEVQPDAFLCLDPAAGGRTRISPDGYVEGAPELVVEVVEDPRQAAASSATVDLHDKLKVYRRNGVPEYLVWQVYEPRLDWFHWHEGEYLPLAPDADGMIRSRVFPGLCLAVPALLEGDLAAVLSKLRPGLASPDHTAFVERLTGPHVPPP